MTDRAFNPNDPVDYLADQLRVRVAMEAASANSAGVRAGLSAQQIGTAIMGGMVTGVVGALLSMTKPDGHDALMEAIVEYLPQARANAMDIINSGETRQ